ncbi:hypothetical protein JTB14_011402 [Gonioctena quinquepunctata]|nr:hypothetical protein JTB14_011402 [Gonioctena quinquepunctata]
MHLCYFCYIPVFILTAVSNVAISNRTSSEGGNIWRRAGKMTGLLLNECFRSGKAVESPGQFLLILQECVKERSLSVFDSTMAKDVIEILDGVEFVRYREGNGTRTNR